MSYRDTIFGIYNTFIENDYKLTTDSRSIENGSIFFALKGDNFDGNDFAEEALKKGAALVVADRAELEGRENMVLVRNSLRTLQDIANLHRQKMGIPIIAITGSNGKTTTKDLIAAVLAKKYEVLSTKGNLNNHIGVPLTLLSIRPEHDFAVVELGANHPGEIALLSGIVQPTFGYITNFGRAHLGGFGGVEGVVKAKAELYNYLRENKKLAFVNADDQKQMQLTQQMERYTFSKAVERGDLLFERKAGLPFVEAVLGAEEFTTRLTGDYNFNNIAAAAAVGVYFGVLKMDIIEAIASYEPEGLRSQWIEKNGSVILMDAYNANPTSMYLAAVNFSNNEFENGLPKIAVLGDMLELGEYSAKEHQHIADKLAGFAFDKIYLIGKDFMGTQSEGENIVKYPDFESFEKAFETQKANYFVKGSRTMQMERFAGLI